jgi:hypothetical protein
MKDRPQVEGKDSGLETNAAAQTISILKGLIVSSWLRNTTEPGGVYSAKIAGHAPRRPLIEFWAANG